MLKITNTSIKNLKRLAMAGGLLTVVSGLSGCSSLNIGESEYGCSGMPDGVQCMSVSDVYAATNDGNVPLPMHPDKDSTRGGASTSNDTKSHSTRGARISASEKGSGSGNNAQDQILSTTSEDVIDNYVSPQLPNKPIPIRTPAEVMRIWVAPWEDTNGDLIVTGYVYTEIEPRRWVIGDEQPKHDPVIRPLE